MLYAMKTLMKRMLMVLVVLGVAAIPALAAGKTSGLNCTLTPASPGIASDGNTNYSNGTTNTSVKCFLGAGGKNFDLVTYSSGRTFTFNFSDADKTVAAAASLPQTFTAEVDAYGINYWGPYLNMAQGSTAQVQMDLQFHYGGGTTTYEVSYGCLAVTRMDSNTWLITSEPGFGNNFAVPCVSGKATLSKIRRNSTQGFGDVTMPITMQFTPQ